MRKCIAVFLIAALALGLSVPAFAEPQYVTTVFLPPEKDEAYWEREFQLNKEQDWEVNGLPAYDGPLPDAPAPTEAERAKWKEDAQKALEEHQQWQETDLSMEAGRRGKLMEQVFGDKLHEFSIPETTFEGSYQEFSGNDGSTTRVYEDGSVDTKYADGSWEGMDNQGNRVAEDKDGNRTISFINGDTGTYRDGTLTVKQTDGATVTYRPDDTISWTNDTGLVIDYNAYGERTAIGFEGGDKVELVHGQLPPGDQKITGPNGAYLDWHNGNTSELSEDGMSVVDGDGNYGLKVKGTNGATGKLEIDPEYNQHIDEEATIAEKQKNNGKGGTIYTSDTKIDVSSMDGGALEIISDNNHDDKISVTYQDPDGNVSTDKQFGNGFFEKTYESADGKERYHESLDENGLNAEYTDKDGTHKLTQTVVNEDGSVSIKYDGGAEIRMNPDGTTEGDFANGVKIALDKDGNPRELSAEGERYTFDEDGKLLEAEFTLPDGSQMIKDENGCRMIRPDGEELTVDAEGNVYDKNGELVKGAHDDEGFDDPSKWAKPETPLTDTPSVPTGDALSRESVTGSYPISGSVMRIREDGSEGTEAFSCTAVIAPVGDDSLSLTIDGTDMGTGIYNESNGTFSVVFDGTEHIACSFRKSGDNVALHLTSTEKTEAGTVTTGTLSGEKNGLTLEAICGTYADVGGSTYRTLDEHWKEIVMSVPEGTTITVFDVGDGCIDFKTSVTGESTGERLRFDPATGVATASYKPEGIAVPMVYKAQFKDLGGGRYSVRITTMWGDDVWLDFTGEKSP